MVRKRFRKSSDSSTSNSHSSEYEDNSDDSSVISYGKQTKRPKIEDKKGHIIEMKLPNDSNEIKQLKRIHKILRNVGKFGMSSLSGEAGELPSTLGLNIKGLGQISLPITDFQVNQIKDLYKNFSENVYCIDSNEIQIKNPKWHEKFNNFIKMISKKLGCSDDIEANLQKLILVQPGGLVTREVLENSSCTNKNELGTLILQLPSSYTGGELEISDESNTFKCDFGQSNDINEYCCTYAAFYSDLDLKFKVVDSGLRLFLVYSINWLNESNDNFLLNRHAKNILQEALKALAQPDIKIAIDLDNSYSRDNFLDKGVNGLQNQDLNRFNFLKEVNDMLDDDHNYSFALTRSCASNQDFSNNINNRSIEHSIEEDRRRHPDKTNSEKVEEEDRSKISRSLDIWYDENGFIIFKNSKSNVKFFTKIIKPSNKVPFVNNLDDREAWIRKETRNSNVFEKHFLVLWPKKYENRILVKMDLKTYIRSTYKELLCDYDANFYNAVENLDLIVNEVINEDNTPNIRLEYEHVYNILESLKFIQDKDLILKFIKSSLFKIFYLKSEENFSYDIIQLVNEFVELKEALLDLMLPITKESLVKNCKLIREFFEKDHKELAFEFLERGVLPIFNNIKTIFKHEQSLHLMYMCRIEKQKIFRELMLTLVLFKMEIKLDWDTIKSNALTFIDDRTYQNLDYNFELAKVLHEIQEDELALKCLEESVLPILKSDHKCEITFLITKKKLLVDLLQFIAIDIPIDAKTFDLITKKILECKEVKLIEYILEDIIHKDEEFRKNPLIKCLFKNALEIYEVKMNSVPEFTWEFPLARTPRHPEIEEFLRSNKSEFLHSRNFNCKADARTFFKTLTQRSNGNFSVTYEIECKDEEFNVRIIKTRDYAMSKCDNKDYFKEQIDKIKKALK